MGERSHSKKSAYDTIVEKIMDKFYGVKFNGSLEVAVNYSVDLLNLAQRTVFVTLSEHSADLWQSPKVMNALRAAEERGIDIRIILGPTSTITKISYIAQYTL